MLPALAFPPGVTAGVLTAVAFNNTISTGVLVLSFLTGLGTVVGIIYGVRWKTAYQVEKATSGSLSERASVLAHERDDVTEKLAEATRALLDAHKTIARLEALPNLEAVLQLVGGSLERFGERQERMHRENVELGEERTARLLTAISQHAA